MCRLKRQKLEVVVPVERGERYRNQESVNRNQADSRSLVPDSSAETDSSEDDEDDTDSAEDEESTKGKKTRVEWIEKIPPSRFYLRGGLGRKASGSYYTPHSFARFLVQETLGPQVA